MSTICKLDRNVRLDRMLRKMQLREMSDDLRIINRLIDQGHRIGAGFTDITTLPARAQHRRIMADMLLKRAVLAMTLNHLTKVFHDSSRTGERKEAIFQKLGASGDTNGIEPVQGAGQMCALCGNVHDLMSACPPRSQSETEGEMRG